MPDAETRIGEVYLDADEIAARVRELGAEIAHDYAGREPLLVGSLKSCIPFVADLSMAIPMPARARLRRAGRLRREDGTSGSGSSRISTSRSTDRDVLLVDEVVDTGLTLHYLVRSLALRSPGSLHIVTLFDRPYRRLVDDLPVRYVGFTIPDEFFVGYGFELDERYRNLPDLRLVHR